MLVSADRLTEEMRNSYMYLREEFSGKYLALYVTMENGIFVIIVNYTLDWAYYENAGRKPSKETYLTKTRGK